jgi:hypothetical protein
MTFAARHSVAVPAIFALTTAFLCASGALPESSAGDRPTTQPKTRFEIRIAANEVDDRQAIEAAEKYFGEPRRSSSRDAKLDRLAEVGLPPPAPKPRDGNAFTTPVGHFTYSWVAISSCEARRLRLTFDEEEDILTLQMKCVIGTRLSRNPLRFVPGEFLLGDTYVTDPSSLLFSRDCEKKLSKEEYFLLVRDPEQGKAIAGQYLRNAERSVDGRMRPVVNLQFSKQGGELLQELTSRNQPSDKWGLWGLLGRKKDAIRRHLTVIVNDEIVASQPIVRPIGMVLQISGHYAGEERGSGRLTREEADSIVNSLGSIVPRVK